MVPDCLFCRIADGEIPAEVLKSTDKVIAIRDINPQAPVHVLVISRAHFRNASDVAARDPRLLGEMANLATEVAAAEGLEPEGFRLVINTGANGGQTVDHVHIHLIGGRPMSWPPG